ncbi:MAG: rod-binding protein [Luminiphilus sp.]|jgi:peptidoglycan hydrolase FlgJ|nr:rod-binding protein [Luminiphilus sp.]
MEGVVASYNDFEGLAKLRAKAQKDEMAAAKEVGQQFEAFFIQMMLKSMRDATAELKSGLWDSSTADSYEEMFDAELSTSLAKTEGFGITNWLVQQLENPGGLATARKGMGVSAYQSLASVQ